jgi:hypothetical protein
MGYTPQELRNLQKKKPAKTNGRGKINRYNNVAVRTEVDGIVFDSASEAKRYNELKLLVRAKEITDLKLQVPFPIIVNGILICTYVADFTYTDLKKDRFTVEDRKGVRTDIYKLKRKMVKAVYGIDILET